MLNKKITINLEGDYDFKIFDYCSKEKSLRLTRSGRGKSAKGSKVKKTNRVNIPEKTIRELEDLGIGVKEGTFFKMGTHDLVPTFHLEVKEESRLKQLQESQSTPGFTNINKLLSLLRQNQTASAREEENDHDLNRTVYLKRSQRKDTVRRPTGVPQVELTEAKPSDDPEKTEPAAESKPEDEAKSETEAKPAEDIPASEMPPVVNETPADSEIVAEEPPKKSFFAGIEDSAKKIGEKFKGFFKKRERIEETIPEILPIPPSTELSGVNDEDKNDIDEFLVLANQIREELNEAIQQFNNGGEEATIETRQEIEGARRILEVVAQNPARFIGLTREEFGERVSQDAGVDYRPFDGDNVLTRTINRIYDALETAFGKVKNAFGYTDTKQAIKTQLASEKFGKGHFQALTKNQESPDKIEGDPAKKQSTPKK